MLVLSRKNGEDILIPQHDIVITVVEARNGKARIGITAPSDVKIIRRELQKSSLTLARLEKRQVKAS